jgi:hypothetical protein
MQFAKTQLALKNLSVVNERGLKPMARTVGVLLLWWVVFLVRHLHLSLANNVHSRIINVVLFLIQVQACRA